MKKAIWILSVLMISLSSFLKAQIDVNWSETMMYDNKLDGFFEEFVGSNSKLVFAKYDDLKRRRNKTTAKAKLIAYDKHSMEKVGEATFIDIKKDKKGAEKYKGLKYYKTVVFENLVYVFWKKEASKGGMFKKDVKAKDELYVQTFDGKLNPLQKLKKIYELSASAIFVMANKNVDESIIIGGEVAAKKGDNLTIEYKVLKSDLSFLASNQVELPVTLASKSGRSLSSSYEYGDDGNLHIKTYVTLSKEDRKSAKKGEAYRYPVYSVIELASGKIQSYSIKFENKNIFNFDYVVTKDAIKLVGFFCDLIKDPRGNDTHGIFYAVLDPKTFQMAGDMNFTMFTKQQLDELFAKDKDKGDRSDKRRTQTKKKKKSEEESLASDYVIENIQSIDKNNIAIFCSVMYNYAVTTCDGKGNCTTRYYCQKDNVTAFKIDDKGKIVWASNLDRRITYNGWNVWDLKVASKDGKFFVAYGSDYSIVGDKKNRKSRKSKKYKSDRFEYAMFDYATGKFTKNEYKVNPVNVKKKDKKTISALAITELDNELFVSSKVVRIKPLRVVFGCLGGLVCPPVAVAPFMFGNSYKGKGNLARITLIK